ncbi:MAG: Transcriptional regulator [Hyphomicrobiales bacterium]|nr:Transcriptional regulator [Hyphomicrobiales bacterium]
MATIKDVARRAGVAISTVSAVINRSAPVSEAAIERVERAIADIGYTPHGAAQSLRSGQSRIIGMIMPTIFNPHFATAARVVENICLAAGYMSVVYSTGEDSERENQILKMMRMQRVAGLIIIPSASDAEHGARLNAEIHVPTVLLDSFVENMPHDVVKLDNVKATRIAMDYLIELGHQRIGILAGRHGIATSDDRLQGCIEALQAAGLPIADDLIYEAKFQRNDAYEGALQLMSRPDRPTALLAFSNLMTLGMMQGLTELNLSVPDDVSIAGIDDFDWAEIMSPRLTVVSVPIADMAKRAIDMLLAQIESKQPPTGHHTLYQPTLIVRGSCVPLP